MGWDRQLKRVYRVSVRETWLQHFLVEAESVAEAVAAVKQRGGANVDRLAGPIIAPDGIDYLGAGAATARVARQTDGRPVPGRRRIPALRA